ncbi:Sulfite exporter TauE/SafE [Modicisalibacter ilicicola DSM 19980]|uniref:Probable membrane transporter protein n=1 Tax=Modicisalibacter ilicicola DSM 19980 TaxID=1121942 RepID=A0A1M4TJD0_9GAMM|nr:TSUP family transporter [Halomonas ilicicola]SHE44434.1 Sulfite exporter TauE/SafE [Halomonas ilicicola DSM 19980]
MTPENLLPFLVVTAMAGYFQTVTGFGLGMIVIGLSSSLGIVSVATVAAVVSLQMVVNSAVALPGKLQHVHWPAVRAVVVGLLPAILGGVLLLDYLSASASNLLQLALGGLILYGGISMLLQPSRQTVLSSSGSFFVSGVLSGLCGGLFATPGPPLIYQCYRQPLPLIGISSMLILFFSLTSLVRTLFIAFQGQLDTEILVLAAWSIPVIAMATYVGRRFPPPLSAVMMRRLAFLVLVGIGGGLVGASLDVL